jgi:putative transposase
MPRKQRICLLEVTYHVTSRCIENKQLMGPHEIKMLMIDVLTLALEKYDFELAGYTIMDNHFHFYIKTVKDGESISRIMQFIKSQFARRYNRMMNRTGPFWNERFSDTIIESSMDPIAFFFFLLFYLAFNPVRRSMVTDPRHYQYSSIMCYFDKTYIPPVRITMHEYFIKLGTNFDERVSKLLEYEEMYRKRIFPTGIFV